MKLNKRALIKRTNWALGGILGVLGFSNCIENGADEYGTPWADYAIKGTVVNKTNGKPVEGIKVDVVTDNTGLLEGQKPESWIATTNAKGEFQLSNTFGGETMIAVTDIDGEKNGSFVSDTLKVNYDNDNSEIIGGGKGWNQGTLTATVKVELTEKKADE
jgi:putative lipoprotein (rSAM/lipoprotein system)